MSKVLGWAVLSWFGMGLGGQAVEAATGTVNVQVVFADGTPAAGATVRTYSARPNLSITGSNAVLTFLTVSNRAYYVQGAGSIQSNTWVTIATNIVGNGGVWTNIETGAGALGKRFYRVAESAGFAGFANGIGRLSITNMAVGSFTVRAYHPYNNRLFADVPGEIRTNGQVLELLVRLPPTTGDIAVWVNYTNALPVNGVAVMMSVGGYSQSGTNLTGNGVTFSYIPLGGYTVTATALSNPGLSVSTNGTFTVPGETTDIFLTMPSN